MARSFSTFLSRAGLNRARDPRFAVRVILGALLAANLIAAGLLKFPPGGSAEDLGRQMASLETQVAAQRAAVEQTRQHAMAVAQGRTEGDQFIQQYFLPIRTASGTLNSELLKAAAASKVKTKTTQFALQPIEGSDTLQMVVISATYEGQYPDLLKFVHSIDQSPLLLIIESLNAAPQEGSNMLSITMRMDAFVRGGEGDE